jgi:hypothetical protein
MTFQLKPALARIFDRLHDGYASPRMRRGIASLLLGILCVSLLLIELNQRGLLPAGVHRIIPMNHFVAVEWAVEVLLLFEVIELIFGLARAMDGALGKQLEVFALILLRKSFEELKHFSDPIDLSGLATGEAGTAAMQPIWDIGADALGALAVFAGLVLYNRLQHRRETSVSEADLAELVQDKKVIGLALLLTLAFLSVRELCDLLTLAAPFNLFSPMFTALVFSDIAIVFLSVRYSTGFSVVFRNFGYTLVTVFVRIAINAPPLPRAALALGLVLYAAAIARIFNAHDNKG